MDLAGIAARKQHKRPRPTLTGGPFAQDTGAFHQRTLRLARVGAVTFATKQGLGPLGGTDGGRVPRRHRSCARHLPAPVRHHGEAWAASSRSEEHTSELQSQSNLVCRLLLEKKKKDNYHHISNHI